jgi:hypothetical protein
LVKALRGVPQPARSSVLPRLEMSARRRSAQRQEQLLAL